MLRASKIWEERMHKGKEGKEVLRKGVKKGRSVLEEGRRGEGGEERVLWNEGRGGNAFEI